MPKDQVVSVPDYCLWGLVLPSPFYKQGPTAWLMAHIPACSQRITLQSELTVNMFCSTLYSGQNSRGTSVYTWVSPSDQTSFDEDISPLLQYLWRNELVSADARLGLVEFGSEAYHSENNVTFSAGDFSMQIWKGEPPSFDPNPVGEDCAKPTSPQSTGKPKKGSAVRKVGPLGKSTVVMASMTYLMLIMLQVGNSSSWLAAVVLWRFCLN